MRPFTYGRADTGGSQNENYVEIVVNWSGQQYRSDNVRLDYKLCRLDVHTPLDQRATGVPAIKIAMDELAHKLGMDPVELRLKNYTDSAISAAWNRKAVEASRSRSM